MEFKIEFMNGYKDACTFPFLGIFCIVEKDPGIHLLVALFGLSWTFSVTW